MTDFVNLGTLTAGDDVAIILGLVDDDGVALDITGLQSVKFQINRNGVMVVSKDLTDGIDITSESDAVIEINILATDTEDLSGACEYEIEIRDAFGFYRTPLTGAIAFRKALIANES